MAGVTETKAPKSFVDDQQITALQNELEIIKSQNCPILSSLGNIEIDRLRGGIADYVDLISNKKVKVRAKVDIPSDQYPSTNFVGKLLGPGASTLKSIQEQTNTKMTIRGIDNQKQKPAVVPDHCDRLHLQIDSLGTPAEAFYKLSHAIAEVQKCLTYVGRERLNMPIVFPPPVDPMSVQNSAPVVQDFSGVSRPYPAPIRPMGRGGATVINARRVSARGGARFVPPPAPVDWVNTEDTNGAAQDFSYAGGPIHPDRSNPNRVTPY